MQKPDINVTPLIDVLLVLLIIFMVVTPVKPSKFEVKLPSEPKPSKAAPPPLLLVVSVDERAGLTLNNETLNASISEPGPLIDRLKAVFAQRLENLENEKTVYVKAPKAMTYGNVAKLIDSLKLSGASPVSLQLDGLD